MCCGPVAGWGVVWSQAGPWKETLPLTELSLLAEGTKQFSVLAATWQASQSHAHILLCPQPDDENLGEGGTE